MEDPKTLLLAFGLLVVLMAVVLWPDRGLLAWIKRHVALSDRIMAEDALKLLYHRAKARRAIRLREFQSSLELSSRRLERILGHLLSRELIATADGALSLTPRGSEHAVHLIRSHRLWERYLADRTGVGPDRWHEEAEKAEHRLTPAATEQLDARLGQPAFDPHGDPIPRSDGSILEVTGIPLEDLPAGTTAQIVHIEDEPRRLYESVLGAGLAPGGMLTLAGRDDHELTIVAAGRRSRLPVEAAINVLVRPAPEAPTEQTHATLADTRPGETAKVLVISPVCQGLQRRRLLDLGFVPGTEVTAELSSAMGDPIAYRVRGAVIALRRVQAERILIERAHGKEGR
jgi:DtxR family Mn-dependent transcriptional regulator